MGEQLLLARFVGFDNEKRHRRFPNGFKLSARFEVSTKTAQRSIDCLRNGLRAPFEPYLAKTFAMLGWVNSDLSFRGCR